MAHKIQIKRGNKADLPALNDGEPGLCLDTNEVYVGNNGTNVPVGVQTEIVNNLTTTTAGKALDATQGKALAEQISTIIAIKTATITTTWTGISAPYTQTITVTGVTSNDKPIISPVYSGDNATAILQKEAWNMIGKIQTGANSITCTCFEDKPITAIPIQIKGV